MKIEVLYFEGCPNYLPAVDRLEAVLRQEGFEADIARIEVDVNDAAILWIADNSHQWTRY